MRTRHMIWLFLSLGTLTALAAEKLYRLKPIHEMHDGGQRYESVAVGKWEVGFMGSDSGVGCDTDFFDAGFHRDTAGTNWYAVILRPDGSAVQTHPMHIPSPPKETYYLDLDADGQFDAMVKRRFSDTGDRVYILVDLTWTEVKELKGQWVLTREAASLDGASVYQFAHGKWGLSKKQ